MPYRWPVEVRDLSAERHQQMIKLGLLADAVDGVRDGVIDM